MDSKSTVPGPLEPISSLPRIVSVSIMEYTDEFFEDISVFEGLRLTLKALMHASDWASAIQMDGRITLPAEQVDYLRSVLGDILQQARELYNEFPDLHGGARLYMTLYGEPPSLN